MHLSTLSNHGYNTLFNVTITRAKAHLIVVGDWATCRNCGVRYLRNSALYSEQLKQQNTDSTSIYPLVDNPEQVSEWERFFMLSYPRRASELYCNAEWTNMFLICNCKQR